MYKGLQMVVVVAIVAIVHQEGSGSPLPGTRPAPRGGNLPTCSIIIVTSENLALELFFFKSAEDERDGGMGNSRHTVPKRSILEKIYQQVFND